MWDKSAFERLDDLNLKANVGGGEEKILKQHNMGKLTARERIELLFDQGTFVEVNRFVESPYNKTENSYPGDGVVTGYGKINGRTVFASSEDFTVIGGTLGEYHSFKICEIMDMAIKAKAPYIEINDSGGARIEEGIISLNGYSGIFLRNTKCSGLIPQIAVILGPCAGGACYSPAICDFIFMVENTSKMFVTGPQVVKSVIGEDISVEDLGGTTVHSKVSGVAHFVYQNEQDCLNGVRELLSYLPQNCEEKPKTTQAKQTSSLENFESIVPDNQKKSYDVKKVISLIVDENTFFEVQKDFAKNAVIGFSRINGDVVGIVANQPDFMSGAIDINASDKMARFVRFCDCFNIPLLTLVDVSGFLPGSQQESGGIIRHGAKLLYAYSEAEVPKISLIMRKAYGGAYIAMNSKNIGADLVYAWPIAQIAVMGADGAVSITKKRQLSESENSQELKDTFIKEYEDKYMNPYIAAKRGYVSQVIYPTETREKIINAFNMLKTKTRNSKARHHGNIPL